MYFDILRRLRDVGGRKHPKNGEPAVDFSFTTCRLVLIKDFLAKNNVTSLEHTWLQLIFTYSLDRNEH